MSFYIGDSFSPKTISPTNIVLWLKSDAGVNGGAAVNGDAVYEWADQSGNSHHFTQTTGALQPIYNDSVIGGEAGITFLSDTLVHIGLLFDALAATDFTIYVVMKLNEITDTGTENQRKTLMKFGTSGWTTTPSGSWNVGLEGAISTNGAGYQRNLSYTYGNYNQILLGPPDLNSHYISILSHGENYLDGVQKNAGPGATLLITGDIQYLGGWNNSFGQFSLSEIIVYNIKHTDAQRLQVESYLKDRFTL
jgi:hypothetical protein